MQASTPRYLGAIPHPAVGVRIPDIFLDGILSAFSTNRTVGGLMLSCTREAAPQYVIDAEPGKYPITLGHTGVSIREYMIKCAEEARKSSTTVQIEADHLIVGPSVQSVQRIIGESKQLGMTENEISKSVSLVKDAIDEATSSSQVNAFTVDTTSLVDLGVEQYSKDEVAAKFSDEFPDSRDLVNEYSREFVFSWIDGRLWKVQLSREEVMRMALEFKRSLEVCYDIYSHVIAKTGGRPFGFELTLDELPKVSGKELLFYLREWRKLGAHVDFVAPNIGFRKRSDYDGDLRAFAQQLSFLAAIANAHGALLSIHSGSGQSPQGGKGKGVYEAILESTGGRVKYKISGIYFELLMELLANSKTARHRRVFETIFDDVTAFLQGQISTDSPLADKTLRDMFSEYSAKTKTRDSRSQLFRYYSFIALNLRDAAGHRYLKDELVILYEEDAEFKEAVDREVKGLTLRLIDGLNFRDNLARFTV